MKIGPIEIEEFEVLPLLITIMGLVMMVYGIVAALSKPAGNVTVAG